jgi:YbbR domain-containing protein
VNPILNLFSGNTGAKVVSVIVAIVLWVVVLGSRAVEVTKEIPIMIATPADLVVSNEVPEKVLFRLSGPKAFLRAILDRPEDPIRVNLSGAKSGLVTYRFFADNIRLPIGVRVLQVNPSSMIVKLESQKTKEVPVRLDMKGTLPEGYVLKHAEIKPKTIKIRGPESRIEGITEAPTNPIDLSQVRSSIQMAAQFDLARLGVRVEGENPQISVDVAAVQANYKIRVKGTDIRVDSEYHARIDEAAVTVYVRMDEVDIQKLDPSQVSLVADLKGKTKGRYTAKLKVSLPPNIGMVRAVPDTVRVTLY